MATFQKVQITNRQSARGLPGGRNTEKVSSLFPSLIFGQLEDPMNCLAPSDEPAPPPTILVPAIYKAKGTSGHGRYLVAETDAINKIRKRNHGIEFARWPYPAVEFAILKTLQEIDWKAVVGQGDSPESIAFANRVATMARNVEELRKKMRKSRRHHR